MKQSMKYLASLGIVAIGAALTYKTNNSEYFFWSLLVAALIAL